MVKDLLALYSDITESKTVSIQVSQNEIEIKIIARWFENMNQAERLDYLLEAIEAIYPEVLRRFKIRFIALTPRESN